MSTITLLGSVLFGGYFIYSGIMHFVNAKGLTGYAKMKKVPAPSLAVSITGLLMVLGGLGILFNVDVQQSIILLLIFLVPTTFIMHDFWNDKDATMKMGNKINFLKNVAIIGALLMMFH